MSLMGLRQIREAGWLGEMWFRMHEEGVGEKRCEKVLW
jgi:hypothetical protein